MITIGSIIGIIASSQGVASFIEGIAGSYIANYLPILKNSPDFERSAKKCFKKAAKEWGKIDESREIIYSVWVKSYEEFVDFCKTDHPAKEWVIAEVVPMWLDEMRNNEDCRQLVTEIELVNIQGVCEKILEDQKSNTEILNQIAAYQRKFRTKGTMAFQTNEDYIERSCDVADTEVDFLRAVDGYQEKTLADFVLTGCDNDHNVHRFALYSSMQTGKTTELEHLGWTLQEGGIYQPILISVGLVQNLSFDDLPEDDMMGHKPIVLMIDALDETREDHYRQLTKEIENYTKHHDNLTIVVSCRSNFRSVAKIEGFLELELLPLHWAQTQAYIRKKSPRKATALIKTISKKELFDLANNPLTLNTLIDIYNRDGHLPLTQSELFEELIKNTIKFEFENGPRDYPLTEEEEMLCMERVAGMMLMMGKRKLTETEFKKLLKLNDETQYEHLRYDIIQRNKTENGNVFSFSRNVYLEYMAAKTLLRCKDLNEVKEIVCFDGTNLIKNTWFTPMLLWMEMMPSQAPHLKDATKSWLLNECWSLAIHAQDYLLSEMDKGNVIIQMLEENKKESVFFYDYGNDLNPKTRKLPLNVVMYILEEWKKVKTYDIHLKNVQLLTRMIDWYHLRIQNRNLADELTDLLFALLNTELFSGENAEWILVVMTNDYFLSDTMIKRLYEVVRGWDDIEVVEAMMVRISNLKEVDDYIDYIMKASRILGNDRDSNNMHILLRNSICEALSKIKTKNCFAKVMSIMAEEGYWRYTEDKSKVLEAYLKFADEAKKSVCYRESHDCCDLRWLIKEAEKLKEQWIIQERPEPTEEQIERSMDHAKNELNALFDINAFKKQAEAVMAISDDGRIIDLKDYFDPEKNPTVLNNPVSHYVITFLIKYSSLPNGRMKIDKHEARKNLDNQILIERFRLGELKSKLIGGPVNIELSDEQRAQCVETAQGVVLDMLHNAFDGRFYPHEQVALSLYVKGDFEVEQTENNCKNLLRYVGLPIDISIYYLYDEDIFSSLLERLKRIYEMEMINKMMFELVQEAKTRGCDPNAYNIWVTTLLDEHYQPAVEFMVSQMINSKDLRRLAWLPNLVKNKGTIDTLKAYAEKNVGLLSSGDIKDTDIPFVINLCRSLMKKGCLRDWTVGILERMMDYVDVTKLRACLEILVTLDSQKALAYILNNPHILRTGESLEFKYTKLEDIPLLVKVYNVLLPMKLFVTSYNSLLESLHQIAMRDRVCLQTVKDAVVTGINKLTGTNPMTPQKWAGRLDYNYIIEHQKVLTANEALAKVCDMVK